MSEERPRSPINGVELPAGRRFERGEEQREMARRAGKRSGEVRRARKTLRDELLELLTTEITDSKGNKKTAQVAMSSAILKQAISGNTKAYEIIRDTIGEKPVESVTILSADFSALDAAFKNMGDAE